MSVWRKNEAAELLRSWIFIAAEIGIARAPIYGHWKNKRRVELGMSPQGGRFSLLAIYCDVDSDDVRHNNFTANTSGGGASL